MNAIHVYSENSVLFVELYAESYLRRNYLKYLASGVYNNIANLNIQVELLINCNRENGIPCL